MNYDSLITNYVIIRALKNGTLYWEYATQNLSHVGRWKLVLIGIDTLLEIGTCNTVTRIKVSGLKKLKRESETMNQNK